MKKNNQEGKNQKVLFYTGISRAFRTTSIAHLYEISQVFPVVLLSEELDKETENIIGDKTLFPKLEEIIPVRQFTGKKRNLFSENIYVHELAKGVIKNYKPDIVILPTDTYLFDLYLMRFAKKINAINIVLNSDIRFWTAKEMSQRTDLTNAHFRLPSFLPFPVRFQLMKVRKYLGYVLYNWFLPLLVGEKPFSGKSSRILYSLPGERADFRIVCSEQDYDLSLKEGIPPQKLMFLLHPMVRQEAKMFFKKANILNQEKEPKNKTKILTLLFPQETYGFKRDKGSLINEREMLKKRIDTVKLIANAMEGWKIFIKPHPAIQKTKEVKDAIEPLSPSVVFADPADPIDKYIEMSDAIAGLPPASSTLFTAALQCPKKPILSLDLNKEIFGDFYKNLDGIEHIESEEKLINILGLIRDGKYEKEVKRNPEENKGFKDTVELLNYLIQTKT